MIKKKFSTGIPSLDAHLGGIFPGDSLVAILSHKAQFDHFVSRAAYSATVSGIRVVHFAPVSRASAGAQYSPSPKIRRHERQLDALKRFAARQVSGSLVLVDELSSWKVLFR